MNFFNRKQPWNKFSNSRLCIFVYILFIVTHIYLVWTIPYFPTQDGPSHIYNLVILNDLIHGGMVWGKHFTYSLNATPNLGFHVFTLPLLSFIEAITVERFFLSFYIILLGVSVPLVIATFTDHPPFSKLIPFLIIPVIFNFNLMMGFYSYIIAIPVFFLAISMAWKGKSWPGILKFIYYNTAGAFIFILHLIPFVFFLIALAIFSIVEHKGIAKAAISLSKQLIQISPLIILLLFYLLNSSLSTAPTDFSYFLSINRAQDLLATLFTFSTISFSPWQILPVPALWFAMLLLLRKGWRGYTNGNQKISAKQKAMLLLTTTLTIIYLLAPTAFGGGGYFNSRFPWVILLLLLPLLAGLDIRPNNFVNFSILASALLSLTANSIILNQKSEDISTFVSGLQSGCSKGDLIMLYKPKFQQWPKVDTILHAPSYYGILNGCVDIGNYEARLFYFPIKFKENISSYPPLPYIEGAPHLVDLSKHPEVDKVLGWDLQSNMKNNLQLFYEMSFEKEKLSTWKRRKKTLP